MRWIEEQGTFSAPAAVTANLIRAAVEKRPDNALLWVALGDALMAMFDGSGAVQAYRRASALGATGSDVAYSLARALWAAERFEEALDALNGADDNSQTALLRIEVLQGLKRSGAAVAECWRCIEKFPVNDEVTEAVLTLVSHSGDGGQILEACDRLPADYQNRAACIAFRAVAYSLLGRDDEANALIDLENQVTQYVFEPPDGFTGLSAFNSVLAKEILDTSALMSFAPDAKKPNTRQQNCSLGSVGTRSYLHLKPWIEQGIERHIAHCQRLGCDPLLARSPLEARLFTGGYGYTGVHHNGCHIHSNSIVTGVYHVSVPGGLEGDAGMLQLGLFPTTLAGRVPCWPQRTIRAVPGTLTIFPSYVFHDFVPTGVAEPRVAIGMSVFDAVWPADN